MRRVSFKSEMTDFGPKTIAHYALEKSGTAKTLLSYIENSIAVNRCFPLKNMSCPFYNN
jgi:hypothetical protein